MNEITPEQATPRINPLLERARIPGQTFALPSKGLFYKHGELDDSVKNGEVTVYPMVTLDELVMKTPDKLLNGTAINEVFSRCIPQIKKPSELLSKDVDFLLICLRKVSYGDEYEFDYKHDCEDAKNHLYRVPLDPLISTAKKITARSAKDKFMLTLPNGQVVRLMPPRYHQMLKFYQSINEEKQNSDAEVVEFVIETSMNMVESVDGIEDREMIMEWATQIPAGYTTMIGKHIGKLSNWGPDLEQKIICRDCGKEATVEISLNPINFFS